jgi:[acyl-carrier-protein] S-malonyltransferase
MKKVAFIFPGQGSQTIGMGKDFFENSDIAKEMISKASARLGIDFEKLLFEENENIGKTEFTQPAILLVSSIANAVFKDKCNITPEFVLGHSLGEFSALVAAGAIDYLDAIELVHKRGLFMTEACAGGGAGMMALVGIDDATVEKVCTEQRELGKRVWPANYNMDGQLVLAGIKADLESLVDVFKAAGAKRAIVLDMSVASHCELLQSAVENLKPFLEEFLKDEFMTVISNVSTNAYTTKNEAVELLSSQLTSPVKYKQSIKACEEKVDLFIDIKDFLMDASRIPSLVSHVKPKIQNTKIISHKENFVYLSIKPKHTNKFQAYIPIMTGCNNFCAYCVVPYARGREVYRPHQEILAEVKRLLARGYKEIVLIAQNVNSYYSPLERGARRAGCVFDGAEFFLLRQRQAFPLVASVVTVHLPLQLQPAVIAIRYDRQEFHLIDDLFYDFFNGLR